MADIWVISDTHFNHAKILDFKDYIGKPARSFDNVDQMNEAMMDNWQVLLSQTILLFTVEMYCLEWTKLTG